MIKYIILLSIIGMSCYAIPNKKVSSESIYTKHKDMDLLLCHELPTQYKHEGTINAYNLNGELQNVHAEYINTHKETIIMEYYKPNNGQFLYNHLINQLKVSNKDYEKFKYGDVVYYVRKENFSKDGKGNTSIKIYYTTYIDFYHKENGYYQYQIKQFQNTKEVDVKALIHSIQFLDAKNN